MENQLELCLLHKEIIKETRQYIDVNQISIQFLYSNFLDNFIRG